MKKIRRITSIVLTIMVLFVFEIGTPAHAIAETARPEAAIAAYNSANDFQGNQGLAYSSLEGEDETQRQESLRVFRRTDGIQEAVLYPMPVNYMTQGKWAAINNTLERSKGEDGEERYINRANDFQVS